VLLQQENLSEEVEQIDEEDIKSFADKGGAAGFVLGRAFSRPETDQGKAQSRFCCQQRCF
jgi:hypothetical protein